MWRTNIKPIDDGNAYRIFFQTSRAGGAKRLRCNKTVPSDDPMVVERLANDSVAQLESITQETLGGRPLSALDAEERRAIIAQFSHWFDTTLAQDGIAMPYYVSLYAAEHHSPDSVRFGFSIRPSEKYTSPIFEDDRQLFSVTHIIDDVPLPAMQKLLDIVRPALERQIERSIVDGLFSEPSLAALAEQWPVLLAQEYFTHRHRFQSYDLDDAIDRYVDDKRAERSSKHLGFHFFPHSPPSPSNQGYMLDIEGKLFGDNSWRFRIETTLNHVTEAETIQVQQQLIMRLTDYARHLPNGISFDQFRTAMQDHFADALYHAGHDVAIELGKDNPARQTAVLHATESAAERRSRYHDDPYGGLRGFYVTASYDDLPSDTEKLTVTIHFADGEQMEHRLDVPLSSDSSLQTEFLEDAIQHLYTMTPLHFTISRHDGTPLISREALSEWIAETLERLASPLASPEPIDISYITGGPVLSSTTAHPPPSESMDSKENQITSEMDYLSEEASPSPSDEQSLDDQPVIDRFSSGGEIDEVDDLPDPEPDASITVLSAAPLSPETAPPSPPDEMLPVESADQKLQMDAVAEAAPAALHFSNIDADHYALLSTCLRLIERHAISGGTFMQEARAQHYALFHRWMERAYDGRLTPERETKLQPFLTGMIRSLHNAVQAILVKADHDDQAITALDEQALDRLSPTLGDNHHFLKQQSLTKLDMMRAGREYLLLGGTPETLEALDRFMEQWEPPQPPRRHIDR